MIVAFDLAKDWGRSDNDRRHRLVVSGAVQAPLGIDVSAMAQAYSAPPLIVTSGVTTIQATAEGIAEAFNVTNRVNVLMRNANFGAGAYPASPSPTFRDATSVGEARSLQVRLRLRF